MKRVLLTGATGIVGIALARLLVDHGVFVTAIVRPDSKRTADVPVSDRLEIIKCSLDSLASLPSRLPRPEKQYDVFFHLGWNTASREIIHDPVAQLRCIAWTLDAVNAARELGCKVFVGAGSQAEYGRVEGRLSENTPARPETAYGIAKLAAGKLSRQLCERLDLRHGWCRILSVYGPFDKADTAVSYCIRSLLKGKTPSLTKAEQIWDYLYAADCAKALFLVAEKGRHGAAYPIGSGQGRPLCEYFETIRDIVDPSARLGFGEKACPAGQIATLWADIETLAADTGFAPDYSFEDGIKETVKWIQSRNA